MPTTPRLGLPYPVGSDEADVPSDVQALAESLDGAVTFAQGTLAARPAAAVAGRFYRATDTGLIYLDIGSAWLPVGADPTPIGHVVAYAGASPPAGWLVCNGQAVSRSTYSGLFAVCGTVYGEGDSSTTFNLPDLRGRTVVGAGAGTGLTSRALGAVFGAETHTLAAGEIPAHRHPASDTANRWVELVNADTGDSGSLGAADAGAFNTDVPVAVSNVTGLNTGGGGGHNNMQPSVALTAIIKALANA